MVGGFQVRKICIFLGCSLLSLQTVVAGSDCLEKMSKLGRLLHTSILPTTGMALLKGKANSDRRVVETEELLRLSGFKNAPDIEIRVFPHLKEPHFTKSSEVYTLQLPPHYYEVDESTVRRFLVGHPLHPQIQSAEIKKIKRQLGEPEYQPRQVQLEAAKAFKETIAKDGRSFLLVSPTSTGKTYVIKEALKEFLKLPRKLHWIVVDETYLLHQLADEVRSIQRNSSIQFDLETWGDEQTAPPLSELAKKISGGLSRPLVIVTTIQSLRNRHQTSIDNISTIRSIQKNLGSITYDEIHNAGAEQALEMLNAFHFDSEAHSFLFGSTATPVHRLINIQKLFGENAFWTYIDTAEEFRTNKGHFQRDEDQILLQLKLAMKEGDITPFGQIHIFGKWLIPEDIELFIKPSPEDHFRSLNPLAYPYIFNAIRPIIEANRMGAISTTSIDEAERLAEVMNRAFESRKFAAFHSSLSPDEETRILTQFKKNEINYLVTVGRLSEGADFPALSAYIDFRSVMSTKTFLQKVGRTGRLYAGKPSSTIGLFFDMNENKAGRLLSSLAENDEFEAAVRLHRDEEKDETPSSGSRRKKSKNRPEGVQKKNFWTDSVFKQFHSDEFVNLSSRDLKRAVDDRFFQRDVQSELEERELETQFYEQITRLGTMLKWKPYRFAIVLERILNYENPVPIEALSKEYKLGFRTVQMAESELRQQLKRILIRLKEEGEIPHAIHRFYHFDKPPVEIVDFEKKQQLQLRQALEAAESAEREQRIRDYVVEYWKEHAELHH
ncbi:MAG: putative helicase [Bacteriovoracaceae bacterium]|nr:putative helicase [Bacteriovoracaceae bacterium]